MNRLECHVTTCQHNCDDLCCLNGIKVEGPAAEESSQTCCGSYEERRGSRGENSSAWEKDPAPDTAISCSAHKCVYNEDSKCHAECVCVGCSCSDPISKSGTECCTFRPE